MIIRTSVFITVLGAVLFGLAGRLDWIGGWVFLIEFCGGAFVVGLWLQQHDPALLAERMKSATHQAAQEPWDRRLMRVLGLVFLAWLLVIGLDARFRWSHVPAFVQALGALGVPICFWFSYLTFKANSFAAPVVKLQSERGQTVIDTGPYRFVRHPMYAGTLFMFLGAPLGMGSWWGLALSAPLIVLIAYRATREERTLVAALSGYDAYREKVRWRLIPGVW